MSRTFESSSSSSSSSSSDSGAACRGGGDREFGLDPDGRGGWAGGLPPKLRPAICWDTGLVGDAAFLSWITVVEICVSFENHKISREVCRQIQ